ncbi:MAG TPA: hypothetical protein VMY05_05485 [Acidobacteriota bacterium]|nr:hypothetical protein [Acidobacteriota bacterium]
MKSPYRFLSVVCALLFLEPPAVLGRVIIDDPGFSDTVFVDSVSVTIPESAVLTVSFCNDQPLAAVEVTLAYDSPDLVIDSFSFTGSKIEYIQLKGWTTFDDTTLTIFAFQSDEGLISFGEGLLGNLYLSCPEGTEPQVVAFDTTTVIIDLIVHATFFTNADVLSFVPQFEKGFVNLHTTCCEGNTGNVDASPDGVVDIGDLTDLIDYLFISKTEPSCLDEANVDGSGDGVVDIGDVTYLIVYLFVSAETSPLQPCP